MRELHCVCPFHEAYSSMPLLVAYRRDLPPGKPMRGEHGLACEDCGLRFYQRFYPAKPKYSYTPQEYVAMVNHPKSVTLPHEAYDWGFCIAKFFWRSTGQYWPVEFPLNETKREAA